MPQEWSWESLLSPSHLLLCPGCMIVQLETLFPSQHSYQCNMTESDIFNFCIICLKGNPVPWISPILLASSYSLLEATCCHMLTLNENPVLFIKERVLISVCHWLTVGPVHYRSLTLPLLVQLFTQNTLASLRHRKCRKAVKEKSHNVNNYGLADRNIHMFFLSLSCRYLYI